MYYLSRMFEFEAAHRLSKHRGKCHNIHGHNWKVEVVVASMSLNNDDMVIDFGDLRKIVNRIMDHYDHKLLLNAADEYTGTMGSHFPVIFITHGDPTSELLAKHIYKNLAQEINAPDMRVHSITVWENDKSKVTYTED